MKSLECDICSDGTPAVYHFIYRWNWRLKGFCSSHGSCAFGNRDYKIVTRDELPEAIIADVSKS